MEKYYHQKKINSNNLSKWKILTITHSSPVPIEQKKFGPKNFQINFRSDQKYNDDFKEVLANLQKETNGMKWVNKILRDTDKMPWKN